MEKFKIMMKFNLSKDKNASIKILCLGAHSDDIEIGCGGTILRLLKEYNNIEVKWIVFSADAERTEEAVKSANLFLENTSNKDVVIKQFRESFFPYIGSEIKDYFEEIKKEFIPDIIFTHYRHDLHQDHRLISELTWNTFRNHLIFEYEIIKYDGDLGSPNLFIQLNKEICSNKIDYILKCFITQGNRNWFTKDAFFSILRIRGVESNAPENYAEAYYCRKMIL
jgi:LmbE family N-acetylglucosaminyl deacetylase